MEHTDPVCGMEVGEDTPYKSKRGGETIYFCSASCKHEFDQNPDEYVTETEE